MNIGVSSYSFSKYREETGCSYFDICDKAKEIGFDGIEFIDFETEDPISLAKELRAHCENIGIQIIAYTVGANLLKDDIEDELKRLFGCIDVCEALGAKLLRHDVCFSLPERCTWEEAVDRMTPHIRTITEYAKTKGIKTCTENHGHIFQAPERVENLIKTVNNENYGWLCDMGNFLCVDVDPLEAVKVASKYAFHVHAKDFHYLKNADRPDGYFPTSGGNWLCGTILGRGVVPLGKSISVLKQNGYNGWFSLEFEGPEDCLTAIKEGFLFLKNML